MSRAKPGASRMDTENKEEIGKDIVWFGEGVPLMEDAIMEVESAEVIIVVGTSMQVYPASSLVEFAKPGVPIYLVDPNPPKVSIENLQIIAKGASEGLALVASSISPR